jgi:protein-disulfide isomerase
MDDQNSPTAVPQDSAAQELPASETQLEMPVDTFPAAHAGTTMSEEAPSPTGGAKWTWQRLALFMIPLLLAVALGVSVGYLLWGRATGAVSQTNAGDLASLLPSSDPSIGPANAPITIVEFSDYECPFCREWQSTVYDELLKAYPNRIRFVYRDFPLLSIHPDAEPAAEAADCAGDQGKYWDFHDRLLAADALGEKTYLAIAGQLGLDTARFTKCIQSQQFRAEVMSDFKDGVTLGINGTPTFFVNGYRMEGAQPLAEFKKFIDQVISQPVAPGP